MFLPSERSPLGGALPPLLARDLARKPVPTFRDHAQAHYPRRPIDLTRTRDMVAPSLEEQGSKEQAK